jgi:hypothetical protein
MLAKFDHSRYSQRNRGVANKITICTWQQIEEPLPNNASHEIAYSYDQAVRILNGASMEQVIADYEASVAEQQAQKPTPAKKMSTVELLKKTSTGSSSKGTPKQAAKSAKGTPSSSKKPQQRQQQEMEEPVRFKPGEQIIVDTQIGMWPGIVGF